MPEQLEADAPPAPVTPAVIEAPVKAITAPAMVVPQRPPDDPGLPEDFDAPSRKSIATDG